MAELTIRFDLRFGARSLQTFLCAGMLLAVAQEVGSENVTLTTYYPAPSGVYTQMITTGNTYLSRDASGTIVGSNVLPAAGTKLAVMNGNVGIRTTNATETLHVVGTTYVTGSVGLGTVPVATKALSVAGNTDLTGNVVVTGSMRDSQTCATVAYGLGWTACPGGMYATMASGFWSSDQIFMTGGDSNGKMLCCAR